MFNSAFNIIVLGIIFFLVFLRLKSIKNHTLLGRNFIYLFTVEHFSVTFIFAFFLDRFTTINDPQRFYAIAQNSSSWFQLFGFGNSFMSFLAFPLVKIGLTIETCFFAFSFFGWLGFMKLFKLLEIGNIKKIHLYHLFFFLPSIHLWTSSLSKEPLLLFLIVQIIYFCCYLKESKKTFFIISLILILFIRPHVFIIMFSVFMVLYHFRIQKFSRSCLFLLVLLGLGLSLVLIKYFLKIEISSISSLISHLIKVFESQSILGRSGISIIETNFLERILYLLFMPLPILYKTESVFQMFASIENLYYVVVFGYLIFQAIKLKTNVIANSFDVLFTLVNAILMMFFFASYLYNLGLGNRMRIMIYPFLFYFLIKNLNPTKSQGTFK